MQVTRSYYNASNDLLRIDTLYMNAYLVRDEVVYSHSDHRVRAIRRLKTQLVHTTSVSRVVSTIEVVGDYDSIETSSGDFLYASWTEGNGQVVYMDMSDLPKTTETV